MRAVVVTQPGGPEVLKLTEMDDPQPGPGEVVVDVKAAGVNRADAVQRRGNYPLPPGIRADILGLEAAGVVSACGEGVQDWAPGDRVFALLSGEGYAEKVCVPAGMLLPIPTNLDFVEAAGIAEVYYTAFDALFNQAALQPGESVLVHAVGSGVGTAAVQLAHNIGARTFGTAGSAEKLEKARSLGLDVGVYYREVDFLEVVMAETKSKGVDVILDLVGASYWERNLKALAMLGRMVLIGTVGGTEVTTRTSDIMRKRLRIFGTLLRGRPLEEKLTLTRQFREQVLPLLASGDLRAVIDRSFPLEQAAEAHRYLEENRNFGKIVLTV
ncbi:MAG TPA: NAD(P)H-quinone oxidoreductase [Dehalococcoidia bacterium]|nr:NAD(P)H-quinone oxidoreductase [Dehalococcoidia bacterium]